MNELAAWQNFYVIIGPSAGALIGLQFVVMTLVANRPAERIDPQTGGAFATPTIIHFSAVLALSGLLSAPWPAIAEPAFLFGGLGLAGIVYTAAVIHRLRRQTAYRPVFEDWLFHAVLPLVAHGTLAASACAAWSHGREALFGVGAAVLLLLLTGIHNAWDAVTYHIYVIRPREQDATGGER